ncbi:hypothetical protein QYZ43_26880, partial [Vibrio parahaemolyticus]|nr:hypothetical protein [Vibrio parahaemolyticus]
FAPRQTVRRYRARRDDDMIRTLERPTKRPRSIIAAEKMLFNHTLSAKRRRLGVVHKPEQLNVQAFIDG